MAYCVWLSVAFVLFAGSALPWEIPALHCALYGFCECGFRPDVAAMECDLARNVFGQNLAHKLLVKAMKEFLDNDSPSKPLVLSFHGWSGTGKTFEDLRRWIQGNLTACGRSVFVFEEMDKMHPGMIDTIASFLGSSWVVYGSNYRKAIFIFISNAGGEDINEIALDYWRHRKDRDEIQLQQIESAISKAVSSNPKHGFWQSQIIDQKLIDVIVPFLPLRPHHVRLCIENEMLQQGLALNETLVNKVADSIVYFPEKEKVFSLTGCKTIASRLSYYV
ncbi:hypothetical protein GDO86_015172 [Hymenochirus boettgeri]|uniref:Torsin family 2 member A n=1 Tax=Hymenochirus boettgeri TaxID=247094 RepID=A0A8T2K058_9PIPI|nr:hypothetical protein GDO86_015172 [Hymenochirus boettgeri]